MARAMCAVDYPDTDFDRLRPEIQNCWRSYAKAIGPALEAAGYVIAPRDPTQAMCVNGGIAFEDAAFGEQKLVFEAAGDAYRAMLAAKEP